eukprot:GEMP01024198.1.p1 GENE.GEMP01024198.1~~GEMP01024198.1.p1  ORF type:complete len:488 (+),score=97.17 GEMP01024198.1:124-1587(+)
MNEFVDYYDALGGSVGPQTSTDELQKRYKALLLNWHPDKRPQSATGEGKRQTCILNTAWDTLRSPRRREAYDIEWTKAHDEQMLPFERAEDRRRKGNDMYREAHALCREGKLFEAAQKYMAAVESYTDGIKQDTSDHRLFSNRALCYAALQDWTNAKKDALETTRLRPNFMKGWFTLCRSYLMDDEAQKATQEIEKALKLCNRHPDLVKLHEEIRLAMGDRNQRVPKSFMTTRNISPACTPPTPRRFVNPLVKNGPQWGMDLEQTAQFGADMGRTMTSPGGGHNGTANFGLRTDATTSRFHVNPPMHPSKVGARIMSQSMANRGSWDAYYSNLGGTFTPPSVAGGPAINRTPPPGGAPLGPGPVLTMNPEGRTPPAHAAGPSLSPGRAGMAANSDTRTPPPPLTPPRGPGAPLSPGITTSPETRTPPPPPPRGSGVPPSPESRTPPARGPGPDLPRGLTLKQRVFGPSLARMAKASAPKEKKPEQVN